MIQLSEQQEQRINNLFTQVWDGVAQMRHECELARTRLVEYGRTDTVERARLSDIIADLRTIQYRLPYEDNEILESDRLLSEINRLEDEMIAGPQDEPGLRYQIVDKSLHAIKDEDGHPFSFKTKEDAITARNLLCETTRYDHTEFFVLSV